MWDAATGTGSSEIDDATAGIQSRAGNSNIRNHTRRLMLTSAMVVSGWFLVPFAVPQGWSQTWTGDTSTNWFDKTNWSMDAVPTDSDKVYIDTSSPNATVVSDQTTNGIGEADLPIIGNSATGSLTIDSGVQVTVSVNGGDGTMTVAHESGSTGTVIIAAASGDAAVSPGNLSATSFAFGSGTGSYHRNAELEFYQ